MTFLFDSQERTIAEGSVAFAPNSLGPADLFQWKVTSGTDGVVTVRSFGTVLIGSARWESGTLTAFRQEQHQVPSDRRWRAIEDHLARLLGERAARAEPADPALVDRISWFERRRLYDRVKTDWIRKGRRYDQQGRDAYFERKARWITLGVMVLIVAGGIVFTAQSRRSARRAAPRSQPATPAPTPAATAPARATPPSSEDLVARAASVSDGTATSLQRAPG